MTFVLGLTGGIASGKSTVLSYFLQKNIPVIDGDKIAREIVEIGKPALKKIITTFGKDVVGKDGGLNRSALATIIFNSPEKRELLDQIMDPFLRLEIKRNIQLARKAKEKLVVVDLPLLFELDYTSDMTKIAVVYIPKEEQLKRLMHRNQLTFEQAIQRINSQLSLEEKREKADILFDNSKDIHYTNKQVEQWLRKNHF